MYMYIHVHTCSSFSSDVDTSSFIVEDWINTSSVDSGSGEGPSDEEEYEMSRNLTLLTCDEPIT